jgi:hypothetical protein
VEGTTEVNIGGRFSINVLLFEVIDGKERNWAEKNTSKEATMMEDHKNAISLSHLQSTMS